MSFKSLIGGLLIWRFALVLVSYMGTFILPVRSGYTLLTSVFKATDLLNAWASFDGMHYLTLAKYGYGVFQTYHLYAFFPVYPLLMQTFNYFGSYLNTGLFISHVSLFLSLYFLYKLLCLDVNKRTSKLTVFLMLIFPTSFFFGSLYTESLFLLETVLSFYFVRKGNYFLAGTFGLLASATRLAGIFIWPALILEFWLSHKQNLKSFFSDPKFIWLLLPPLGLLAFMQFQYTKTSDLLFFIHSQPGFGANRVVNKLILIHQVFYRYVKMFLSINNYFDPLFFVITLEFLCGVLFLWLSILAFRKTRLSYSVYCLLSFLTPTFTGTLSSVPRYVLVLFPLFLVFARYLLNRRYLLFLWSAISIVGLIFTTILFTRGYFVS